MTDSTPATTALRPHAGFEVTVTRPDGVTYPAHLCRFDGPHGGIAVLYVEPVNCPADMEPYEQQVYVEALTGDCEVYRLGYTDEQEQRVRDLAWQALESCDRDIIADALGHLWQTAPLRRVEIEATVKRIGLLVTVDE